MHSIVFENVLEKNTNATQLVFKSSKLIYGDTPKDFAAI